MSMDAPEGFLDEYVVTSDTIDRLFAALDFYQEAGKVTEEEYREMRDALDVLTEQRKSES